MIEAKTASARPPRKLVADVAMTLRQAVDVRVKGFEFIGIETVGGRILYNADSERQVVQKLAGDGQLFSIRLGEFPLADWLAALQLAVTRCQ